MNGAHNAVEETTPARKSWPARFPIYYGWINLAVAAVAMTATLPGRTHGLGLITKPLLEDLGEDRVWYGTINFWAIILGAALCWPTGKLIDCFGSRPVLVVAAAALGASVVWMSQLSDFLLLFVALTLIRGLGQGALSVVSMALIGKWFTRRLGLAMGLFSVLLAVGFIVGILALGQAVEAHGWRSAWAGLGWWVLLGLAPFGLLAARSTPESCGMSVDELGEAAVKSSLDLTLWQTLRSPAFWTCTLGISCFNLTWSAVTLFNESVLEEQGFSQPVVLGGHDVKVYVLAMAAMTATGLCANLLAGWLATRWSLPKLLAVGLVLFALTIAAYPALQTVEQAVLHGAALGVCGGLITVAFFALYPRLFGRMHLGQIQAVAQIISVLASAVGPLLLALCGEQTGSYRLLFFGVAGLAIILAPAIWLSPLPRPAACVTQNAT